MTNLRRLVFLLACLWAAPASAQISGQIVGNLSSTTGANSCTTLPVVGMGTGSVQLTGTFAGTVSFTVSDTGDSGDYVAVNLTAPNSTSAVTTATGTGLWSGSVAGYRFFRACMTSYTSGTAGVLLSSAATGGGGAGGGGAAGNVSITQGGNTAAVNASSQLSIICANCSGSGVSVLEDAASANGDAGTPAYTVRQDTLSTTTSTDGDYQPTKSDANGRLYTTGAGGTFPATQSGTWTVQPGNTANSTAWLVTGTGGTFPSTQSGTWTVQPGNTANTTAWLVTGGKTNNNAAPSTTNIGTLPALANASAPSWTEGNQVALSTDLAGNLRIIGSLTANQSVNVAQINGVTPLMGNGASGTGAQRVTIASDSTGVIGATQSGTWTVQPGNTANSTAWLVAGGKTNNNAAPGATNFGALVALANASAPSWTEGNLVTLSTDLTGALRVSGGGGGTQYTQDAALTVGSSVGNLAMGRASAAAPTDVSADNDAVMPWYLRSGAVAIQPTFAGVLATTGNGASGTGVQRVTLANDSTGVVSLAAGAATIGALTANQSVNAAQIAGTTTSVNNGTVDAGTLRVTLASNSTGQVALAAGVATIGALSANQTVNTAQINGVTPLMGNGVSGTGAQRVTIASDSTGVIAVTQSGTWTVQPGNTANSTAWLVAGGKTNNNAAPGATNLGVLPALANASAPSWTEGNLVALSADLTGALRVTGGGGGTQYQQDAALTVATTVGTMAMGRASAAVPTDVSADGDAVIPWYLRSGATATQPTYGGVLAVAGNGVSGTGVQRVTLASDSTGQVALAAGAATIGALTANQSVNVAQINGVTTLMGNGASGTGAQRVTIANDSTGILATVTTVSTVTNLSQLGGIALPIEDAAETAGGVGIYAMGVRRDTPATSTNVTGDNTMASYNAVGAMWISHIDPCSSEAKVTDPFSLTARGVVIAAAASKKNYICAISVVAGAAEIFNIDEGTGTTCQTGTAAIAGSTTAANGLSFAANGGLAAVGSNSTVMAGKTSNVDTCIVPSGSNRLSGFITYVQR